jgi:hypothetical protein
MYFLKNVIARNSFLICLAAFSLSGCKVRSFKKTSGLDTVEIPQTEVKNQGYANLCWAYATVGFMESYALLNKGVEINLSEEFYLFYRTANDFYNLTQDYNGNEIRYEYVQVDESDVLNIGFNISKEFGAIPESVWNFKFDNPAGLSSANVMENVRKKFVQFYRGKKKGSVTLEQIVREVMVGQNAFPSEPPTSFAFKGKNYSGKQFLREALGFNPDGFQRFDIPAGDKKQFDLAILRIKHALARGLTVPLGFSVYKGVPQYELKNASIPFLGLRAIAGHAVLITDFVNKADLYPGALSVEEIKKAVKLPTSELSYFLVKNSYGAEGTSHPRGGYSNIDLEYLLPQLKSGHLSFYALKEFEEINERSEVQVNKKVSSD